LSELRIGTSGWIYKHWRGTFYPKDLPQKEWLAFYAERFDTVEINFSFYRLPKKETFEAWRDQAAPDFRYAVKGSRFITHMKKLGDPETHVRLFTERLEGLGDRTGPVLWQLPPQYKRNEVRLEAFLAALPAAYRHAIEFRHASWLVESVYARLTRHGVALCIPDHPEIPKALKLTTDWTYLRFHAGAREGDYTDAELDTWAGHIRDFRAQGAAVWAYFNNDWRGFAIKNAEALRARLAGSS
jgi:uncharacterized protein YecE (DUF72 family)